MGGRRPVVMSLLRYAHYTWNPNQFGHAAEEEQWHSRHHFINQKCRRRLSSFHIYRIPCCLLLDFFVWQLARLCSNQNLSCGETRPSERNGSWKVPAHLELLQWKCTLCPTPSHILAPTNLETMPNPKVYSNTTLSIY